MLEREYLSNPDDALNLFYLARIYFAQGRLAESLRLARRSIALDAGGRMLSSPKACGLVVECLVKMGRTPDALAELQQSLSRFPDDVSLLYQWGLVLCQADRLSEAEIALKKVLEFPRPQVSIAGIVSGLDGAATRLALGRVYLKQRRWRDAEVELRFVLAARPDSAEAWSSLGYLLLTQGRIGEAATLTRAIEVNPKLALEHAILRAQLSILESRYSDAKRWVQAAMKARPGASEPWIVLSDLLFHEGQDTQACIDAHQKVLSIDPCQTDIRRRLEQIRATQQQRSFQHGVFQSSGLDSASFRIGA
jgi:tetratricopeptide (TPR) repeat protein